MCWWLCWQLLSALQQFSTDVMTRTKNLQDDLDLLSSETRAASLKMHNTFNQFLRLSNSQFIENVRAGDGRCPPMCPCTCLR